MWFSAGWGTKEAENVFLTRGWEFGFECAWGLQVTWHFRVAFPYWLLHGWLGMVPSCVWKMNFENLLGLQFLQNPQYQCSLFQSFSSLSICSSLCICSVITYLYLLFMFRAIISMFYSVGWRFPLPVGRGTAIYGLYSYVPLWRVWFSSSLLWDRVYKSETWSWLNIIV